MLSIMLKSVFGPLKLMGEMLHVHLIERSLTCGPNLPLALSNWMLLLSNQRQLEPVSPSFKTHWVKQMQII